MFGSCGIGEIAISKVTLIRRQKYYPYPGSHPSYYEEQLALSNVKLLRGISFSASRDFAVIPHDRAAAIDTSSEVFVPENLELTVAYLEDISMVKNFVRPKSSMITLYYPTEHKEQAFGGSNVLNISVEGGWDNADRIANRVADTMNRILGSRGVNYVR